MSFQEHSIDADSPIPLYYELKKIILDEIQCQALKPGDSIPTEAELGELYAMSRTPIRQAISELVHEGWLYRVKSKGTFVANRPSSSVVTDLSKMYTSYSANVKEHEMIPVMEVTAVNLVAACEDVAAHLEVSEGDAVLQLKRIWKMDETINAAITSYLPYPLCRHVKERMEKERIQRPSMYDVLGEKPETVVGKVIRRISAYNAEEADAKLLKIRSGAAICEVMDHAFALQTGQPLVYEHVKYVGARNELEVVCNYMGVPGTIF